MYLSQKNFEALVFWILTDRDVLSFGRENVGLDLPVPFAEDSQSVVFKMRQIRFPLGLLYLQTRLYRIVFEIYLQIFLQCRIGLQLNTYWWKVTHFTHGIITSLKCQINIVKTYFKYGLISLPNSIVKKHATYKDRSFRAIYNGPEIRLRL